MGSKGSFVSKRFATKLLIFAVVLFIFSMVHLQYLSSTAENREKVYTMPDTLMKFHSEEVIIVPKTSNHTVETICKPRRNVVFLKTHKTGGTTMTNIFLRYAEKHRLVVGLPPRRKWELAGYPAFFKKNLIDPQLKQYNVLCHHFRMDQNAVSKVVASDAVYITILRDPANAFESGFAFFREGPFSEWMPDYNDASSLEKFLNNPNKYYNKSTPWYFRAKNYEAFDLGFDTEQEQEGYIENVLHDMDNLFDLVMVTERFEESLILLKDLLCMESMSDLLHIRLKVRQDMSRRKATTEMQEQMRSWNNIDTRIYDYFSNRLERKIREYGQERMNLEVAELNKLVDETERNCVNEYEQGDARMWMRRIRLNRDSGSLCEKMSWGEVKFGDYIRKKQIPYANIKTELQIRPEEMERLLEIEQNGILKHKKNP